jgi:hypothetical protein
MSTCVEFFYITCLLLQISWKTRLWVGSLCLSTHLPMVTWWMKLMPFLDNEIYISLIKVLWMVLLYKCTFLLNSNLRLQWETWNCLRNTCEVLYKLWVISPFSIIRMVYILITLISVISFSVQSSSWCFQKIVIPAVVFLCFCEPLIIIKLGLFRTELSLLALALMN